VGERLRPVTCMVAFREWDVRKVSALAVLASAQ